MMRKPVSLIAICGIAGVVLAGCGSSTTNRPAATAAVPARQTPLMSNPDTGGAQPQGAHPTPALGQLPARATHSGVRAAKARLATAQVVQARQTPISSKDDLSSSGAKPLNPCKLVNLSEAQTITDGAITKAIEAPLGPTCIYSGKNQASGITLAVETESFSQVTRHMSASKHLVVGGHQSVCGRLGTQMLLVPLGRYQLLNVTAPCGIARRFAATAVSRLSA
jgi:hypothetical protein